MHKLNLIISLFLFASVVVESKSHSSQSIALDEDTWDHMLTGEWMVEFYAPWCPACKALQPVWKDFASWSEDLGIKVGHVDVTLSPGLSGRFMVTALPTIYHVKDGVFRQFRGPRDKEHFLSFVEEKKWMEAEEVASWKSPGSYQMALVAQFFKLSMTLRAVHSSLVTQYGVPEWGSYVLFALATIFTGAFIGLLLVCVIDLLFPPKPFTTSHQLAANIRDKDEDLPEEQEDEQQEMDDGEEQAAAEEEEEGRDSQLEEEEEGGSQDEGSEADKSQGEEPVTRKRRARRAD